MNKNGNIHDWIVFMVIAFLVVGAIGLSLTFTIGLYYYFKSLKLYTFILVLITGITFIGLLLGCLGVLVIDAFYIIFIKGINSTLDSFMDSLHDPWYAARRYKKRMAKSY